MKDPSSRREFLTRLGLAALGLATSGGARAASAARQPNLVFILADDLGWADTTPYGSVYHQTPNLVRLAARGMRFTRAYAASPLCSPTRSSILTGLHPARIGITSPACHLKTVTLAATVRENAPTHSKTRPVNTVTRLKTEYVTLAESLKDAGYATGHFGKWHLGLEPYDPLHQGFDVDVPHWHGPGPAGSYVAPWKFTPALNFTGQPGEHIEDRMSREAIEFIRAHRDRPFYLNYWCFSVHAPYNAKPELIARYAKTSDPASAQRNPTYAAMVHSLDEAVGRLLDALDEAGVADNTLIIFFSDNGGVHWPGNKGEKNETDVNITSNAPLRGGKATVYEGGTREPMMVVWPGRVKPGSTCDEVVQSVDFYPTILDLFGLRPRAGQTFDGVSFRPVLDGGKLDREAIFCYFPHAPQIPDWRPPAVYVLRGDWKLIRMFHEGPDFAHAYELYHLKDDPGETKNLAESMPDKVRELDALIERFLIETKAVTPQPNPSYSGVRNDWRSGADAKVAIRDGLLVVTSVGNDPWMIAPVAAGGVGPHTVSFRMKSAITGAGQIFWTTSARPKLGALIKAFEIQPDGQWHEYSLQLPGQEPLIQLRIDPGNGKGEVCFEWIRVSDGAGKETKKWVFGNP